MTVAFNNMPGDQRRPLFYGEVNAGVPPYSGLSRQILMGRALATSPLAALKPQNIGAADPNYLAGRGSMLADMVAWARAANPTGELWVINVGDPSGAGAASGTIAITGVATQPGTLVRYVAGERYSVPVAVNDTAAVVAANLATKINAGYTKFNRRMGAPVTAAASTGTVTLTANHAGTEGNGIRIEAGLDGDEIEVAGLTVATTAMSGGTGDVDMAAAFAALGSTAFDWLCGPYAAISQLNAARDFLSDSAPGRWSPTVGLDGHYLTALNGNLSTLTTLGAARNDRHTSILGLLNYPHPIWSIVAGVGGWIAFSKNLGRPLTEAVEIARPLQTLVVQGLRPPKALGDRWAPADAESLYRNGLSGLSINADGSVAIERILTTYQTNAYGLADVTFLSVETMAIAAYVKRYLKLVITSTYPRCVLKDDNPNGVQGVATPTQIRSTIIHAYTALANVGCLVEKVPLFAKYLIVERSSDPNRVNCYLPVDVANQLNVVASNITIFPELTADNAALL